MGNCSLTYSRLNSPHGKTFTKAEQDTTAIRSLATDAKERNSTLMDSGMKGNAGITKSGTHTRSNNPTEHVEKDPSYGVTKVIGVVFGIIISLLILSIIVLALFGFVKELWALVC